MMINAHISIFRPEAKWADGSTNFFTMDTIAPVWAGEMQASRGMQQDTAEQALDALEMTLSTLATAFGGVRANVTIELATGGRYDDLYENYTWTITGGFDSSREQILTRLSQQQGYVDQRDQAK